MAWILWFIPCALANRIRGGWLANDIRKFFPIWATLPSRVFFSGILSIPVLITLPIKISLMFWGLLFIGLLFRWAPWQFMDDPLRDIAILTLRGLLLTVPAGFICEMYIFGFSGALMGLSYWLAYQLPFHHTEGDGYQWIGSDWGELIFGGVLGLFIGVSICFK